MTCSEFVEHMALCAGCERYLDQFRTTIDRLGSLPEETLSEPARGTLLNAFRDWHAG